MKKELKYFLYVFTILGFIIYVFTYYFSDENKKKSYRSAESFNNKINITSENLVFLKSDTDNIIEYVEDNQKNKKKKYKFLELLNEN
tara:strand:- start:405 stop:665 length:261 start_codon:yes stop_codon:yes gene_type:complete